MVAPDEQHNDDEVPSTAGRTYATRLETLSGKRWKQVLNVQAPYRAHIQRLKLGRTLDVGCGTGRNLHYLDVGSVGVDHNPYSVQVARDAGLEAYTTDEFFGDATLSAPHSFESMLSAHVVEHLLHDEARTIFASYLPMIKPGGRIVFITPQERGYASDSTHVVFADFAGLRELAADIGLEVEKTYSFPLPRFTGKAFKYNEFVFIGRTPK